MAYVLTQPFQSESFSGVPNGTISFLRAGGEHRLAEALLSERCSGSGQTQVFQCRHTTIFLSNKTKRPKDHIVSHSHCFVVCLPGETATKYEASHSPPSSAEIKC